MTLAKYKWVFRLVLKPQSELQSVLKFSPIKCKLLWCVCNILMNVVSLCHTVSSY